MAETVFTNQVPSLPNASDNGTDYELGMKFQSAKPGQISAIRFWKASSETGTHIGRIWAATGGTPLVTTTFSNETTSGWQQQALSSPLTIQANTTYVVSVNTNGFFADTRSGLASSVVNGDLSTVADGNNGVYGSPSTFPTNSYGNSNYFVDIVFTANTTSTITKVSGDNQGGTVGTQLSNPLVVQVNDSSGNPQAGITVTFAVTSGGGTVSPGSMTTGSNGQASTILTLGTTPGINTVSATVSGVGSVSFTATANANSTGGQNAITLENQQPGTTAWQITNPVTQSSPEIAGYASAPSVNKGGSLDIKVSLAQTGQFTIDVYRLGYYGGKGGRLLVSSSVSGGTQPACKITDSTTLLIECNWSTSYTLAVGSSWTSGLYIANLTDQTTGKQSQVWFVVRDDSSSSDILFQSSFTTFLAYNGYGGRSLYGFSNNDGTAAFKVSFDKPFSQTTVGQGEFNNILRWERNMVRWMESQGYNISYTTDLDVHLGTNTVLTNHKVFLSVGHDEYWSQEQRNNVQNALANKVSLGFFTSNTCYWRVRWENSTTNGTPNRVMVCYKDAYTKDPVAATTKFRISPNTPENALLGVLYIGDRDDLYGGYDFVVTNSSDLYYANTGLHDGDKLSLLVVFEWDAVVNNGSSPSGLVVLSQSTVNPDPRDNDTDFPSGTQVNYTISNAVRYTASSGGKVFSTGSNQWVWGLDSDGVYPSREDSRAKQITVNVLADLGAKPLTPAANIVVP